MEEEDDFEIPLTWDPALDTFLSMPLEDQKKPTNWTTQTINMYSGAQSFLTVINGDKKTPPPPPPKRGVGGTKEDLLRKMILKPLSPRKKLVLPGTRSLVKERNKYGIERIICQRNKRKIISALEPALEPFNPDEFPEDSSRSKLSVRAFTIPMKESLLRPYQGFRK